MAYSDDGYSRVGSEWMQNTTPSSPSPVRNAKLELLAAQLHMFNRKRSELFNHAVMADRVMDIMLTALIAQEQGTALRRAAAAMANRLKPSEAENIIDALIQARFLEHGAEHDHIHLTALGHELMQEYVHCALGTKTAG